MKELVLDVLNKAFDDFLWNSQVWRLIDSRSHTYYDLNNTRFTLHTFSFLSCGLFEYKPDLEVLYFLNL